MWYFLYFKHEVAGKENANNKSYNPLKVYETFYIYTYVCVFVYT